VLLAATQTCRRAGVDPVDHLVRRGVDDRDLVGVVLRDE
jgi:hypothetical protein